MSLSGVNSPLSLRLPHYKDVRGAVLPAFYGHVFTAEFLDTHGNVSIANLDLGRPKLSVYAAYERGKLAQVAIANLELWDGRTHSGLERPSKAILLAVPPGNNNNNITVKKLKSPTSGTALFTDRITWRGMEWTYESDGVGNQVLNDPRVVSASRDRLRLLWMRAKQ